AFWRQGRSSLPLRPCLIVLMSLQPAIPRRVALQHCPPPLHRLVSMLHPIAETVKHYQALLNRGPPGEFSTGLNITFLRSWTPKKFLPKASRRGTTIHVLGSASVGRF